MGTTRLEIIKDRSFPPDVQVSKPFSSDEQSFEEDIEKVTADQQKATKAVQSHQSQSYDFMKLWHCL